MVQETQFYTSLDHWKLNSPPSADCTDKHSHSESFSMHAQIGHNIPESAYGGGAYPYSISMPSMYNQNSFPYTNNSSSNGQGLSHVSSQQAYPGISMPSYQLDQNQYLANVNQTKPLTSCSSTADSNTSNGSEFDINRNPVKKRRKPAPTIATGRRNLKNESVAPEEAERRDKRRERNRKSAQRCRERKIEKKESLQKEINDVNQKSRKYLDLAENILKAWKERLRFLDEKLPGHNFKSQFTVVDFEQLIEVCSSQANIDNSEAGDTCSPRSSLVDPSVVVMMGSNNSGGGSGGGAGGLSGPVKQEFVLGNVLAPGGYLASCGVGGGGGTKLDQFYQTTFAGELLSAGNPAYDQYHQQQQQLSHQLSHQTHQQYGPSDIGFI